MAINWEGYSPRIILLKEPESVDLEIEHLIREQGGVIVKYKDNKNLYFHPYHQIKEIIYK